MRNFLIGAAVALLVLATLAVTLASGAVLLHGRALDFSLYLDLALIAGAVLTLGASAAGAVLHRSSRAATRRSTCDAR